MAYFKSSHLSVLFHFHHLAYSFFMYIISCTIHFVYRSFSKYFFLRHRLLIWCIYVKLAWATGPAPIGKPGVSFFPLGKCRYAGSPLPLLQAKSASYFSPKNLLNFVYRCNLPLWGKSLFILSPPPLKKKVFWLSLHHLLGPKITIYYSPNSRVFWSAP